MRQVLPSELIGNELSEEQLKQVFGGHHHAGHGHLANNTGTNNGPTPIQDISSIITGARVKF
jgi:hypothetical protein